MKRFVVFTELGPKLVEAEVAIINAVGNSVTLQTGGVVVGVFFRTFGYIEDPFLLSPAEPKVKVI